MISKLLQIFSLIISLLIIPDIYAQKNATPETKINVDISHPGHAISPTLFGIFFEDINLSSDGGIYPELVRNRSFEDAETPQDWEFKSVDGKSSAAINNSDIYSRPPMVPLNPLNRKSLSIKAEGQFTLINRGY